MSETQDNRDAARVLKTYGPLTHRCVGGRIVADGYVCLHCGSDDPRDYCRKPARGVTCRKDPQP